MKSINLLSLLIVFISFVCIVHADTNITVNSINYFTTSRDKTSLDWNSDTINLYPGDKLQLQTKYVNDNSYDVSVKTDATLDLIESIKDTKTVTVPANDDVTIVLEWDVPNEMPKGYYTLSYKYTYTINGTSVTNKSDFDVTVKTNVITTTQTQIQTSDVLTNLTKELIDTKKITNNLIALIPNYSTDLSVCKEALGRANSSDDFKNLYNTKCTDYSSLNTQYTSCVSERDTYKTKLDACTVSLDTANNSKGIPFGTIIAVVGIGAAIYFWDKKNKHKGGGGEEVNEMGLRE